MAEPPLSSESTVPGATSLEHLLGHAAWLRALARHLVDDAAAADDLVQETWLAALRRPPLATRPLQPWLAGVARRIAAFVRRGELRRTRRELEGGAPGAAQATDELVARAELQRRLVERVLALREPGRSTVLLCYYEGRSPSEVAELQQVPAATVRSRLKRALDELRVQFDADERHAGGVDWRGTFAIFAARPVAAALPLSLKVAATLLCAASAGAVMWSVRPRARLLAERPTALVAQHTEGVGERQAPVVAQAQRELAATPAIDETPERKAEKRSSPAAFDVAAGKSDGQVLKTLGHFHGKAILPDGTPAADGAIECKFEPSSDGRGTMHTWATLSQKGEFGFAFRSPAAAEGASFRLHATAKRDEHRFARTIEVPFDFIDELTIQLLDAPLLRVHVVDGDGVDVDQFSCDVADEWSTAGSGQFSDQELAKHILAQPSAKWSTPQTPSLVARHPGGWFECELPPARYLVVVDAPGFGRAWAGPFRPEPALDPAPRDVEIVVRPKAAIAGVVRAHGTPISNARVSVRARIDPHGSFDCNGLVVSVDPRGGFEIDTASDGRFALPQLRAPFGAIVRATADGFAPEEIAVAADESARFGDLVLDLTPGGTICGHVDATSSAPHKRPLRVLAERRDLGPRVARVDDGGDFTLDHLMPGAWYVSLLPDDRDIDEKRFSQGSGGPRDAVAPPFESNCEVVEGGTTRVAFAKDGSFQRF